MKSIALRLGMAQLLVEGGEPGRNMLRAEDLVRQAADKGCEIVLLPECMDLAWTHPSAKTEAKPIPGPYSQRLCDLARELGLYLCAGLTERDGARVYNTAILINDEGEIILKYRKINTLGVCKEYYATGQSLSVVDTPFGKIGVNICSDNYLDGLHIGHTLARMGAQLILSPSSWTSDFSVDETVDAYRQKWVKPYSILAQLHDLVIVGTTSVGTIVGGPYEGKKMIGRSLAVGRDGILAEGSHLEIAGELVEVEFVVPPPRELGTAVGERLQAMGYPFDELPQMPYPNSKGGRKISWFERLVGIRRSGRPAPTLEATP